MDSRERTFLALSFQEPDRVPIDVWMSDGFRAKVESAWGVSAREILDEHDVDLRYIEGPAYVGPPLRTFRDGTDEDIWGVQRRTVVVPTAGGSETYKEVAASPLACATTVEEVDDYARWPSADWFDYRGIPSQCREVREQGRVAVFMGDRLNRVSQLKPAMYLRGMEQIYVDMIESPEIARALFSNIRGFYREYAQRIFEAANGMLDALMTGDDFGSQSGPLTSPQMWEGFLGDGFAEYVGIAKSHDVRVMHHSCGAVRPLVPLMIERGLDVLQSIQPEATGMNPRELKGEFGGRLSFHGGVSIQRTLPFGSAADVRREVRDTIEALAPGGGYIFGTSHNVQADTPVENFREMLDAHRAYGSYG